MAGNGFMNTRNLIDTAKTLIAGDKGLLAMDESNPTCNKRFAKSISPIIRTNATTKASLMLYPFRSSK
jgi:fructose-bisphosphate aldolase class 1